MTLGAIPHHEKKQPVGAYVHTTRRQVGKTHMRQRSLSGHLAKQFFNGFPVRDMEGKQVP